MNYECGVRAILKAQNTFVENNFEVENYCFLFMYYSYNPSKNGRFQILFTLITFVEPTSY